LQRAIEEGADFIETGILASKDGALICFHDVTLDEITDVAECWGIQENPSPSKR
jgi:glycerophosphoryl diester phosphodiesterase